jgi:hypothetical protein
MNVYKKNIVDMQNNFSHAVSSHTTHSLFLLILCIFIIFFSSYWKIFKKMNMHDNERRYDDDALRCCDAKKERKLLNYFN